MRHIFLASMLVTMTATQRATAQQQNPDIAKIKAFERQLDDVMELIDTTELQSKLREVEADYAIDSGEIQAVRLGIIYHETALNLSFLSHTAYKGYAKKSFDILSKLSRSPDVTPELLPFISSYCASALALHAAETKKLKFLDEAFSLFQKAVTTYAAVSYLPEFLRGSVAENLPWYFFAKRRCASHDFQSIIDKYTENAAYANWKVMSFTYWARAKQQSGKKHRAQALAYLAKAIELDPHYKAGRAKAEDLQHMLTK